MAKGKQVTLSIGLGQGQGDIKRALKASTKATRETVAVIVGSTQLTKSEVCESLRQIEREIQGMDWPPAK